MKKCAFLSMDCLDDFGVYDYLVEPFLFELGLSVDTVSWRDHSINWDDYEIVIIRTPWDYQDAPEAFLEVLSNIEKSRAYLENSLDIVRWNIDKIYLQQLEKLGISLIPTLWHNRLLNTPLTEEKVNHFFTQCDTQEIIIKPRISANADNTFWLKSSQNIELDKLNTTFKDRDFMVQPFVPDILAKGEYSLFYFNGQYSHTILKTPTDNDFRVQEEHGGRLTSINPSDKLLVASSQCMKAIAEIHKMPLYARLDLVEFKGKYCLMEAEVIEPSLYFNMDEQSPKRFAKAVVERLTSLKANQN